MSRLLNMRPDTEVEPLLAGHLNVLRKENQAPRSIRERRLTVLRVARALGHPVAEVTRAELVDWQDSRAHLTPAAMHNEIVHVGQFLKWLVMEEVRVDDPSVALVRPRHLNRRLPRPMADPDIRYALSMAEQPLHVWIGLGAFCGLRCMEMAGLAREDVLTSPGPHLRIIGKGDKERAVPLPAHLLAELELPVFPRAGFLFSRLDGKPGPPSATRVSERINGHLHALGIAHTAHTLRHRFGTKLYEETEDPFAVAEAMGHASTDTTRVYVLIQANRSAKAIEAISTLAS